MSNTCSNSNHRHLRISEPSPWVRRWARLAPSKGIVLDLAAGGGRHGRLFLERGNPVTFVDKSIDALADLAPNSAATVIQADLEDGSPWALEGQKFDAIVVVNYLHRPLFSSILNALKPGGVLIYETFAYGNEVHSRPRNPIHLLKSGELLTLAKTLQIVAYEHGEVMNGDIPGIKQRLVAVHNLGLSSREDGQPDSCLLA